MGVVVALLLIARLPVSVPADVGAKITEIVHDAPAARTLGQLSVCEKPLLVVIEMIVTGAALTGLVKVTLLAAELAPRS